MVQVKQTVIVVEKGMVSRIFSTIPENEHIIEVLDLDGAEQGSPDAKDEMEARIEDISNDPEYKEVL